MIPLSVPNLSGNEWKYVKECIDTNWVSSAGSYVEQFEQQFAGYIGTRYAVATSNGTTALHIALLLAGVKSGDEVLVPNLTFVAPLNAVRYCNAQPVLMDCEWNSLGLDTEKVISFLELELELRDGEAFNKTTGARVKAIIPMHTFGYPVDMDALVEICGKYSIDIIEDATESLGSEYKGKRTGNFGKLACFSFNGNKIITTGGGGMIVTNDPALAKRAKHLTTTAKTDPIAYEHDEVGYNYRLVNILAALGVAQLERIDKFIEIKRNNYGIYKNLLESIQTVALHEEPDYSKSNYWMYSLILNERCSKTPMQVVNELNNQGVQARPVWKLMSELPMFKDCQQYECATSSDIQRRIVNIPCSTNLNEEDILKVVNAIKVVV